MLIVLLDEPGLFVYTARELARVSLEPPGAWSEVRAAFDEQGVPYRVEWIRKTRSRFDLFSPLGRYRWVASGPPDPVALIRLIEQHPSADPAVQVRLAELLPKLRAIG